MSTAVVDAFAQTGLVAGIVSEELDEVKILSCARKARYILCTDPLDGSSNTDINGALGTTIRSSGRGSTPCACSIPS